LTERLGKTIKGVEVATAERVDWHNHRRLHGACDNPPPTEYETPTTGRTSLLHLPRRLNQHLSNLNDSYRQVRKVVRYIMTVTSISIVTVPVADQQRALDFYVEKLGLKVSRDHVMTPEENPPKGYEDARWIQIYVPPHQETTILLSTWSNMRPGMQSIVFRCDDAQATYDELVQRGVKITMSVVEAGWGKFFHINDPDGNSVMVSEDSSYKR
jgi:predicted enzyme related to lactoylglutathione lyase